MQNPMTSGLTSFLYWGHIDGKQINGPVSNTFDLVVNRMDPLQFGQDALQTEGSLHNLWEKLNERWSTEVKTKGTEREI